MTKAIAMTDSQIAPRPRIALVDLLRGIALIAMTGFHFSWDLGMFGLIDPTVMFEPGARWTARVIAGSFLFITGFSLLLAHGKGLDRRKYLIRLGQIAGAAAIISLATYLATPGAFIFFGILHQIAFATVAGLLFLRLPWWITAAAGFSVLFAGPWLQTPALDAPVWWWTGLSQFIPVSNDYVPVFPFFGMVLLGIAAASLMSANGWMEAIAKPRLDALPARFLRFLGSHSLVYYLIHQPVMIALIYGFLWLNGRI
jgi:uncharacterized membrane protein